MFYSEGVFCTGEYQVVGGGCGQTYVAHFRLNVDQAKRLYYSHALSVWCINRYVCVYLALRLAEDQTMTWNAAARLVAGGTEPCEEGSAQVRFTHDIMCAFLSCLLHAPEIFFE